MLQPSGQPDLPLEALRAEDLAQLRMKDLEGDGAIVPHIPGEIDRGHAPAPELTLEHVSAGEAGFELLADGGQGSYRLWAISYQVSAISYQLSAISYQLSAIS
jgi:hypothetical protein